MTDNEKLAEFCGLTKTVPAEHIPENVKEQWEMYQKMGQNFCSVLDWNPVQYPQQWYMVLEKLKEQQKVIITCVLGIWSVGKEFGEPSHSSTNLGQAIIDAAMEVIKSEEKTT